MKSRTDRNAKETQNEFAQFFAQVKREHGKELTEMPLPDGLPEYLAELMRVGDQDTIQLMLKVAWQMGAQAGVQAGLRIAGHHSAQVEVVMGDGLSGGLKA